MKRLFAMMLVWCVPLVSLAHTRWFADDHIIVPTPHEPTAMYLGVLGVAALCIVMVGMWLHARNIGRLVWLKPKASQAYDRAAATFAMVCGTFFIIAGTHYYLFSPNLSASAGVPLWLIYTQIAIGLAFLLGIFTRTAAVVLLLVWLLSIPVGGLESAIENIWVVSTALFIAIMGNDYFSLVGFSYLKNHLAPYKPYALSILRLGTGTTLLVLGFSEKILAPELGLNFLTQYHWNFMALLGIPYSDYLFVLSAGAVESLFGLVFILGIVTRLNALVVAIIFTIPLFLLGPIELAGHMPHFAAVVLLLLFGSGGKFMLVKKYPDALWINPNQRATTVRQ